MGHPFLYLLELFSLNLLLYCGLAQDIRLTVEPNWSTFFHGESVTFICDVIGGEATDWFYMIFKDGDEYRPLSRNKIQMVQPLTPTDSGDYRCSAVYKFSQNLIKRISDKVPLTVSGMDVILEGPASILYEGEFVTLRCRHRIQSKARNASFYKDRTLIGEGVMAMNTAYISTQLSGGSSYTCRFDEDESGPVKLRVETQRPKAALIKDLPVEGNVTLTCLVQSQSSGWTYFWYRGDKNSQPLTTDDAIFLSNTRITVSRSGFYWCRGGRGTPIYHTDYITNKATVAVQPSWPEIYPGETITLRCELENGGDAEWEYQWATSNMIIHQTHHQHIINNAQPSHNGDYRCMGQTKREKSRTDWSDPFSFTLSANKPFPNLTVSPSWISPGDSVTLRCDIKHPSAGWTFYWYKYVPKLSSGGDINQRLPGSGNGTALSSYTVHGLTNTASYLCRAARGDPVSYSSFSGRKFAWSGESPSAPSLTLSPNRVQHFAKESMSLSCKGNSTAWRVRRMSEYGHLTSCSFWGEMNASVCNINPFKFINGVYWCESETGQYSNAVNISGQSNNIIMMSPAHPVPEGESVTLSCKLEMDSSVSTVDFYKNGVIIQNDSRTELKIAAVSKSDEGFYKCRRHNRLKLGLSWTSPQSWMSVKSVSQPGQPSPPFPLLLTVGLVCGLLLLLILLLLFLYHYMKRQDLRFVRQTRPQSTNQDPATAGITDQDETLYTEFIPHIHGGESHLYEGITFPTEAENESSEVTYSLIELKKIAKKGKPVPAAAEEGIVYSEVRQITSPGDRATGT